jgi:hypothetical protein
VVRGELLDSRHEPEAPRLAEPPITRPCIDPRGSGSRHPAPSR